MKFYFSVRGDRIVADKDYDFVEGNKGSYKAVFSFDEAWNPDMAKECVCEVSGKRYVRPIIGGTCLLPEMVKGSSYIGVVGVLTDYDGVTRISTNMISFGISKGAYNGEIGEEFKNAAEVWEQYLSDMEKSRKAAEDAKDDAETAAGIATTAQGKAEQASASAMANASDALFYKGAAETAASSADSSVRRAEEYAESIKNLHVEATEGSAAEVKKTETGDGIKLSFTLPKGDKGLKGDKGEKGDTGADGYTPQKGVDYFTAEDIESLNIPYDEVKSLKYYGDANIVPSYASLFQFRIMVETNFYGSSKTLGFSVNAKNTDISGDIVIPYETTASSLKLVCVWQSAFANCINITSIIIPDGNDIVIDKNAFKDCTGLTNVTISKSVTEIGESTFSGCTSLTDVYFRGTKEQWDNINIAEGNEPLLNANIHYEWTEEITIDSELNSSSENPVQNKVITEKFNEVDSKVKSLKYYGDANIVPSDTDLFFINFDDVYGLKIEGGVNLTGNVVIPYEWDNKEIGAIGYFQNNEELTSLIIPNCIKTIGNSAFKGCSNLEEIVIPQSVTYIEFEAFVLSGVQRIYYKGTKKQWQQVYKEMSDSDIYFYNNVTVYYEWPDVTKKYVDEKIEDILEETVNKSDCKGCYFSGIDFANKKVYLCKDQTVPVKITDENRKAFKEQWKLDEDLVDTNFDTPPYDLSAYSTKDTGLYFSINNYTDYHDFCGTIKKINHNVVEYVGDYDGKLPFENTGVDKYGNVVDKEKLDGNDYIFFVPTQPEIGLVKFSEGGISNGEGAIAPGDGAVASGGNVVAGGRFSGAIGRFLKAGYAAFAINQTNKARGANSFAGGNDSITDAKTSFVFGLSCFIHRLAEYSAVIGYHAKAFATRVFVIGNGTQAHAPDQFVGGTYNAYKGHDDKLIIFGNGTSDGNRKNAFTLDKKGIGWFAGDVLVGENNEKLAKVNYIDEKIGDIDSALDKIIAQQESIIAIQNALIGGDSE